MMTKVEEATNEQLNVLVAEKVMEWVKGRKYWFHREHPDAIHGVGCTAPGHTDWDIPPFSPSTDIAQAFEVDKPEEWTWDFFEGVYELRVFVYGNNGYRTLADVTVPLDPNNKTAAYCRGRCICALKACGIEEA